VGRRSETLPRNVPGIVNMAVLMRSVGVTAKTLATTPDAMPASKLRRGERVPDSGSWKKDLISSKEKKRTPSLAIDPIIKVEHPLYNARRPSWRNTFLTTSKRFRGHCEAGLVFLRIRTGTVSIFEHIVCVHCLCDLLSPQPQPLLQYLPQEKIPNGNCPLSDTNRMVSISTVSSYSSTVKPTSFSAFEPILRR